MKLSIRWLRDWIHPKVGVNAVATRLSMAGVEANTIEKKVLGISKIIVGEILSIEKHPKADRLKICKVSNGTDVLQIICGASNARKGLKSPLAMIGATLPGDMKISGIFLRGVLSEGMLCSEEELNLGNNLSKGHIMELSEDASTGQDIQDYLELYHSSIEVDITPNRGDCLSVIGLAREINSLHMEKTEYKENILSCVKSSIVRNIKVLSQENCPLYLGRVISNVNLLTPTPSWIVERLSLSRITRVNIAVDIANYVMLELGQPLHIFDLRMIKGDIKIRMAREKEEVTLLNKEKIRLLNNTLVTADEDKVLAIAGIMGSHISRVDTHTKDIFVESAFFSPVYIAGKASLYGLNTESSYRYERGVDWKLTRNAIEKFTIFMTKFAGGEVGLISKKSSEAYLPKNRIIELRLPRVTRVLGLVMSAEKIKDILSSLNMKILDNKGETYSVEVPSYRFDINLEIDLIEEIARIYGYDNIPTHYPKIALRSNAIEYMASPSSKLRELRRLLIAYDYQECINYSFTRKKDFSLFNPKAEAVLLSNPISSEMSVMRTSLIPGLMNRLKYNLNRQKKRVRLFESGHCFTKELNNDAVGESLMLSGVICGARYPEGWGDQEKKIDFFDLKSNVECLLYSQAKKDSFTFKKYNNLSLHPGQSAVIESNSNGEEVGYLGRINPKILQEIGIDDQHVFAFEISMLAFLLGKKTTVSTNSQFPEIRRDLSLILDNRVEYECIKKNIRENSGPFLSRIKLFDFYQSKEMDEGKKSLAIGIIWKHPLKTLTDDLVNSDVDSILESLKRDLGVTLR